MCAYPLNAWSTNILLLLESTASSEVALILNATTVSLENSIALLLSGDKVATLSAALESTTLRSSTKLVATASKALSLRFFLLDEIIERHVLRVHLLRSWLF